MIDIVIYSFLVSGLSEFLQKCYQPGMIFRSYYVLMAVTYHKTKYKWLKSLTKPLATCIYCQNAWLTIILYPFPYDQWLILSLGGSYLGIEIINKLKD